MLQISDGDATIHLCTFQVFFQRAKVNLRFPSLFFVEWKTINSKHSVPMIGRKRAINSVIDLDQTLTFTTEMIYHRGQRQYLKKESLIHLNLISNSRPDQIKLVGRVVIDLAEIANKSAYASITTSKLMYCSVEAEVSFKAKFVKNVESNMELNQLEKSAFSDLYSFTSPKIIKNGAGLKEILGEKKFEDQKKRIKAKLSDRQENGPIQKMNNFQNTKHDKILIRQQVSDQAVQNSVPKSLPLTQKKQDTSPYQIQQQRYTNREYVQDAHHIDQMVHKQRDLLERQLNQHKNRIQKLETDIRAAMKKFSESEEKSQLHKSRLVETQHALHELMSKQNKIRAQYQQKISQLNASHQSQIEKLKQNYSKDAEITKSSYQADIKILKSKFQEERLKTQEIQANLRSIQKSYLQALVKLKQPKVSQNPINTINVQIQSLTIQNQNLRKWLSIKTQQQSNLSAQFQKNKSELQRVKRQLEKSLLQLTLLRQEKNRIQENGNGSTHVLDMQLKQERQNNIILQKTLSQSTASFQEIIKTLKQQIQALKLSLSGKPMNQTNFQQFIMRKPIIQENFKMSHLPNQDKTIEQSNVNNTKQIGYIQQVPIVEENIVVQPIEIVATTDTKVRQQDGSKFIQMQEELLAHKLRIQELESSIQLAKQNYEGQIQNALKELAAYQAQNAKLAETVSKTLNTENNSLNKEAINAQQLKQQLKNQDASITRELQTLKARSISPELDTQLHNLKSQKQKLTNENYELSENYKLLEMECVGLKQEKDNLKAENQKLVLQYENLKNSRNKIQDQVSQSGLQSEQLILIKQQLQNERESKRIQSQNAKKLSQQLETNKAQVSRLLEQNQRIRASVLEKQPTQIIAIQQITIEKEQNPAKVQIVESLHIDLKSKGFGESPIKIPSQNQVIHVQQPSPNNGDTPNFLTLNTNPHIEQKLNNSAQNVDERHHFNFQEHGVPLTHEEINNFSQNRYVKEEQINALKQQNQRLKDEIQQLKSQKGLRENIPPVNDQQPLPEKSQIPSVQIKNTQVIKIETQPQLQLVPQTQKISNQPLLTTTQNPINTVEVLPTQAPIIPTGSQQTQVKLILPFSQQTNAQASSQKIENPSNTIQQQKPLIQLSQKQEQYKHIISQYQQANSQLNAKIQELEGLISKTSQNRGSPNEKESQYISEIQQKLYNLEQQIKIKDELLNQSQKNYQQSYAIKYELADLKEQYNQLKAALDERDVYINQLQETKEFLSKEMEQIEKQKSEQFQFQLQKIECQPEFQSASVLQGEAAELRTQIDTLHGQLINLNNQNTDLKSKIQDISNVKLQIERQKELLKNKQLQNQKIISQLNGLKQQQKEYEQQITQINQLKAREAEFQLANGHIFELTHKIEQQQQQILNIQHQINQKDELIKNNNQVIEQLKSSQSKLKANEGEASQKINLLNQELQKSKSKIEELILQAQYSKAEKEKEPPSPMQRSTSSLPHLQIHTMSSYASEASPIIYQRSTIRLPQGENVHSGEDAELKKNIESLKKEIENLQAQLAQQSQQKFFYFNQAQNSKTQVLSLEQQLKQLKSQNQRLTLLPLQSFDTTHLLSPKKQNEIITVQAKEGYPSIMNATQVNKQAQVNSSLPSAQSQSLKKQNAGQTELQTKINNEEVQFIRKQKQILKEQLQSERKLHYQLQQIHKICLKKYQILSSRYQNCTEQIQYYQSQNDQLSKLKQKAEDQLFNLKATLIEKQNQVVTGNNQQLKIAIPINSNQQILQPQKVNEITPVGVQTVPTKLWQQDYQSQLSDIMKSEQFFKNKAAILQENIENLEKTLQEQIQINQTNQKLSAKLEALNQLQTIAQQFKSEMSQIKRQNQQLKRQKSDTNTINIQDPELTKLVEQHKQWSQERNEWQKKLEQIQQNLFNNQSKYATEKSELQQKIIILQNQKSALEAQRFGMAETPIKVEDLSTNNANNINENLIIRQQELLKQIEQIRGQKLEQLQKVALLEQKINTIDSSKTVKEMELQQLLTVKNHEIEELKFISQTSVKELEEQKLVASQLQLNYDNKIAETKEWQKKYEESLAIPPNSNKDFEEYKAKINSYEQELTKLGQQVKMLEEERLHSSSFEHLASDVDKLQLEIANKIALIQQISTKNTQLQEKILALTHQLQQSQIFIQNKQSEKKLIQDLVNKTKSDYDELSSKKIELQNQLKLSKQKHEEIVKNKSSVEDSKEIILQKVKKQVETKQKEVSQLQQKLKQKESQILKQTREHEKLKLTNIKNQQKINNLTEKQKQMKQTMTIVQVQSKKIVEALKARFQSQQAYYKKYVEKQRQCNRLTFAAAEFQQNIANKQRQLFIEQEKAEQLRNQLQLIKKEAGAQSSPKPTTIEYEKYEKLLISNEQLMNKNRQYLQVLGNKATINIQNQRLKSQVKSLSATSTQAINQYNELKTEYETKIATLTENLLTLQQKLEAECQKVIQLTQQQNQLKQKTLDEKNSYYQNLIKSKNDEIDALRQLIKQSTSQKERLQIKTTSVPQVKQESKANSSQISILNEQIFNLTNEILNRDQQIQDLKTEIQRLEPGRYVIDKNGANTNTKEAQIKQSVNGQWQKKEGDYKSQIGVLQKQLINLKRSLPSNEQPLSNGKNTELGGNVQNLKSITNELHQICLSIKQLCEQRNGFGPQSQMYQAFIKKYDQIEEQFNNINIQTSAIQLKARFISKQLLKIKAHVVKSERRATEEKKEVLAMINPCLNAADQLVKLAQTLSEPASQLYL